MDQRTRPITLSVKELVFGVSRPQQWWDEHPDQETIFQDIKESIKNNGMEKPLEVTMDKRGYVVKKGNQRLRALVELGITTAPCLVTKRTI
jgi:ParB-like chromosome segregation protein Spo0J